MPSTKQNQRQRELDELAGKILNIIDPGKTINTMEVQQKFGCDGWTAFAALQRLEIHGRASRTRKVSVFRLDRPRQTRDAWEFIIGTGVSKTNIEPAEEYKNPLFYYPKESTPNVVQLEALSSIFSRRLHFIDMGNDEDAEEVVAA